MKYFYYTCVLASLLLYGCREKMDKKIPETNPAASSENTLSDKEIRGGWKLLFDGKTFDGWRTMGMDTVQTALWKIENGEIHKVNSGEVPSRPDGQPIEGGDLMTIKTYDNYE